MDKCINFEDIVSLKRWQKIQNFLADFLGVTIVTISADGKQNLTQISNPGYLCHEFLRESPVAVSRCMEFSCEVLSENRVTWREGVICPFGFYIFFIPLEAEGKIFAYMRVGPLVLGKGEHLEGVQDKIKDAGLSLEMFLRMAKELRRLSFYNTNALLDFLHDVFVEVLTSSLQRLRMENVIMQVISGKEDELSRSDILFAVGEVIASRIGADRYSFMLWDEKQKCLYIDRAKGLPDEVVRDTRIKIGEHISGIVAQKRRPFVLTGESKNLKAGAWMLRPEIKAAISYPVIVDNELIGVMNMASYSDNPHLVSEGLSLIERSLEFFKSSPSA